LTHLVGGGAALAVVPTASWYRTGTPVSCKEDASGYQAELLALGKRPTGDAKPGFRLPPAISLAGDVPHLEQGWQLKNVVKESNVKEAGNGRYALESLKKGQVVVQKLLVPMAEVSSLKAVPYDAMLTFACEADLEKYINLAEKEGGYCREECLKVFEHFIHGFDGVVCVLNLCACSINHADETFKPPTKLNIEFQERYRRRGWFGREKTCAGVCVSDIEAGEEMHTDYRRFKLPCFYIEFTQKQKVPYADVRSATLTAVYGGDTPDKTGVSPVPWKSA